MTNVIVLHLDPIKQRHYVQKATTSDHWVAFYKSRLDEYLARYGEDFNLIIYGDENVQDDYISIPYSKLKDFLTDEHINERNQRWVFSIDGDLLRIHRNIRRLDIREYRANAIDIPELYQYNPISRLSQQRRDKEIAYQNEATEINQAELENKIRSLDRQARYREGTIRYYQRRAIVVEYAKRRAEGRCQLCGSPAPFSSDDGRAYLEAHHIQWLSSGGLDIPENTSALCPNCHRKMHVLNLETDRNTILSNIR
jgi:5-methylcytosine-specific restriction endonuclease McrA